MEDKGRERRNWPRVNINLTGRYRVMSGQELFYQTTVVNLSAQGVCFLTKQPLEPFTEVELQLNMNGHEKITVTARVMWVSESKERNEFMAGVKIVESGKKDEEKFIRFYCRQILIAPKTEHKILVVDDEQEMVELIKIELEQEKYIVVCAYDGLEGYEQFLNEKPDLVIVDLMLPKLNGYELCRKIRREHQNARTPILMISAKKEDEDRIISKVIGAQKYITKPFDPDELLEDVETLLQQAY